MPGAGKTDPTAPPGVLSPGRSAACRLLTGFLLVTGLLTAVLSVPAVLAPDPAVAAETTPRDGLLLTGTVVEWGDPGFRYRFGDTDPLSGVRVELLPVADPWQTAVARLEGRTVQPVATTRSDAEGRYRLAAPEPGLWRLRMSAPGRLGEQTVLAYLPEETHRPLAVPAAREMAVRVVDPEDRPVAGALIAAARVPRREGPEPIGRIGAGPIGARLDLAGPENAAELFGRTDDDGRATLVVPPDTPLRLTALAPGFAPTTVELETAKTSSPGLRLRLGSGDRRSVRVRDAGDRPVPGAVVLLGEPALPAGRTGEDGTLEILAPAGETLTVRALAPDLSSALATLEPPEEPASGEPAPAQPLVLELEEPPVLSGQVVEAGARTPLAGAFLWAPGAGQALSTSGPRGLYDLRLAAAPGKPFRLLAVLPGYLPQGLTVEPRQVRSSGGRDALPTLTLRPAAAVTGTVVDSRGEPVADVGIRIASRSDRSRGDSLSGPQGRFFVAPLEPGGPNRIYAEKRGYAPSTVDLPLLEPRRTVTDVRVVLREGRSAHGRVVTAAEDPVAGAEVRLLPRPQSSSMMERFFQRRLGLDRDATHSDAEGAFVIENVAEGLYNLRIEASGFAPAEVPGLEIPAGDGLVDLGTVVVETGVRVEGRVVDPDDRPVAGARIRAVPQGSGWGNRRNQPFEGTTDAAGHFAFGDLRRGERVSLLAEKPGYAKGQLEGVEVPTEEPVEIVLEPAARVSGTVKDPEGRPVEGARVAVDVSGGRGWGLSRSSDPTRTDAEGRFTLADVPPGDVTLQADAEGYLRDGLLHLRVEPGARVEDVEITLTPGATVLGRVVGPDGEPLPEARVSLLEEARRFGFGGSARTDGDGRYRLEGVPPGARTFAAVHESHPRATRDLEVRSGENRLDFRLPTGQEVSGRVADASGRPVSAATVWLAGMSRGESRNEVSASDGSFHFSGVADGRYRLQARHPEHGETALEEPLEVQGAPRSGLELRFQGRGVIRGQVVGLGLDDLAGIDVRAFSSEGGTSWARPDFEGRFRLEGLSPGTWTLLAFSPRGRQISEEVELPEAAPEADVVLEFRSGFTLTGQVLVGSEPLSQGSVNVHLPGGTAGGFNNLDHQGRFRIEGLEEGTYQLRLFSPGGISHHREVEISGDLDLLIELEAASLSGRVLDAATSEPLAGVQVRMSRGEDDHPMAGLFGGVRTDATGLFRFRELTAGSYRVVLTKEGYGRVEQPVDLAAGSAESIEVRLEPAQGLELRLSWTDGALPAPWVQVTARGPDGRSGVSGGYPVGESGSVRLTSLPPGSWEIRVSAPGAAVTTVQAAAPGPPVPVTLSPEARLEVTVPELFGDGTVATLEILGPDGRPLPLLGTRSSVVLRSGRTSLDQLPIGTWTVRVTAADGRAWSAPVTTRPGRSERLVLE